MWSQIKYRCREGLLLPSTGSIRERLAHRSTNPILIDILTLTLRLIYWPWHWDSHVSEIPQLFLTSTSSRTLVLLLTSSASFWPTFSSKRSSSEMWVASRWSFPYCSLIGWLFAIVTHTFLRLVSSLSKLLIALPDWLISPPFLCSRLDCSLRCLLSIYTRPINLITACCCYHLVARGNRHDCRLRLCAVWWN